MDERSPPPAGRFPSERVPAILDPVCGEAESFLHGLIRPGQKYRLQTVQRLLALLGDPHAACTWVQIGGTNGKGSTSAIAAQCLRAAGHRTGLFTSPHLVSLRERSRVDGVAMSREELARQFPRLRDAIVLLQAQIGEPPSFFEALFALSCLHFRDAGVRVAVAEVGLGGRLDATTALAPAVTALTTVSWDHVSILGPTLADIAREKCGIAKPGVLLLSAVSGPGLAAVVERCAGERGATVKHLDREVTIANVAIDAAGTRFELGLPGSPPRILRTRLVGRHQARNAALAAWLVRHLPGPLAPDEAAVSRGIAEARWPARFECLPGVTPVVWDAGHNPEGVDALASTFREVFPDRRAVVLAGFSADKELGGMLRTLSTLTDRVVITKSTHWRAADPAAVALVWRALGLPGEPVAEPEPARAIERIAELAPRTGLVLFTGSIYMLGELVPLAAGVGLAAPEL